MTTSKENTNKAPEAEQKDISMERTFFGAASVALGGIMAVAAGVSGVGAVGAVFAGYGVYGLKKSVAQMKRSSFVKAAFLGAALGGATGTGLVTQDMLNVYSPLQQVAAPQAPTLQVK